MYPLKGSNTYGQQSYSTQQPYSHPTGGGGYSGTQISTPDGSSQHAMVSRQSSMLNSSQDADVGGYRLHSSQASQYSGPYASLYGSSNQQVPGKGSGSSGPQVRTAYSSSYPDGSKFGSGAPSGGGMGMSSEDYVASGYGHKVDHQYPMDRRHYGDRQNAFMGRDDSSVANLQSQIDDQRYFPSSQKSESREQYDQALLYRQQQMLKVQSHQLDPDARQADYLPARAATMHHGHADISSPYGGRMDADPRNMSVLGGGPYSAQRPASILGGPSRSNVDLVYRVGLPPSRDYDVPIQGRILSQGGFSGFHEEQKDDRSAYQREVDLREERRRELALREREKEREKELERERERERERDRERLRERERLKERERERDRERERQRLRERERERELLQKQREKEKERERDKRGFEHSRHERQLTPLRTSKDRLVSSANRDERLSRSSPRRDNILHRRHSPVKDRRREYVCKVSPLSFVDPVRDYMSLAKRYPRLSISPEFSKVVINWPKEILNISLYLPVSFQHEFEVDIEQKDLEKNVKESQKSKSDSTVWNAKVILMSGISNKALEEICSEQSLADRIFHFNNLLKFAILRKDHSFTAIGGPWNSALDGGDPSTDDTSLILTAKRFLKDSAQLDLDNCQHWNKFMEIHYDRVSKDGLHSHREITVLYLPDLSNCLPSIDQWKSQWLAHKAAGAEKHKKLKERDVSQGGQKRSVSLPAVDRENPEIGSDLKRTEDMETPSAKCEEIKLVKEIGSDVAVATGDKEVPVEDHVNTDGDDNNHRKPEDPNEDIVKGSTPTCVRTFVRKKVIKKVLGKTTGVDGEILVEGVSPVKHELEAAKVDVKSETVEAVKEETPPAPKAVVRKKIIRKVIKKKVVAKAGVKRKSTNNGTKEEEKLEQASGTVIPEAVVKTEVEEAISDSGVAVNKSGVKNDSNDVRSETIGENTVEEENKPELDELPAKEQVDLKKHSETCKQEEDGSKKKTTESKPKSAKESREKRSPDAAAPEYPGLFFRTKQTKESKARSFSLSLDGLLDYNQKDTEESTFELSLFAESFYEMIQFEMGRRLLTFLQNLHKSSVARKNQQKRERDESSQKEERESPSACKRLKSADNEKKEADKECPMPVPNKEKEEDSAVTLKAAKDEEQVIVGRKEEKSAGEANRSVKEQAMEEYDDFEEPEEMSDYDQEMDEIPPPENEAAALKQEEAAGTDDKAVEIVQKKEDENKSSKDDKKEERIESKQDVVDRDLLQAFIYFDRNRVGYLRVEDMRLIIHNLGLFLSHKEVKEVVQSALLESGGSSRENRIMYLKLVMIASELPSK